MSGFGNKLSSYTMTQLNEFLEDDEKLNKIVQEMEEMQEVQQTKEMTLASNRSLAEQNLSLQPSLEQQKSQLTQRYTSLQDIVEAYQVRKTTLDNNSGSSSLDMLLALLQAEGAKIEEETENMAESFLDGDVTLDTFIDEYQSKRKLAHYRRVKIEKLQEMVLLGQQLPQAQALPCPLPLEASARPATFNTEVTNISPVPQPRRRPPPPPTQPAPALQLPAPAVYSFQACPYPPIPPRVGQSLASVNPGYPAAHPFMAQYPPALPKRPPPRMAPQHGFIIQ